MKRLSLIVGVFVVLVIVLVGIAYIFSNAAVTITPKAKTVAVEAILQSKSAADGGGLIHSVATATTTLSESVAATERKQVERKASGTIVIYNNFGASSQRLIKNTRFESPDGRIYRIDASVVVPGQRTESGKTVPGSISAVVYADAAGEEYNMRLTDLKGDFTIPGFKGTDRFNSFYARLQTDIVGGLVGIANVVDPAVVSSATLSLKARVKEELWNTLKSSLPSTDVLFPSNFFVEYHTETDDYSTESNATITVTGVGRGIVYNAVDFSTALALRAIPDHPQDQPVLVRNLQDLAITPRPTNPARPWEDQTYLTEIKGNPSFIWQFDVDNLRTDLTGSLKREASKVFAKYPGIERAEISLRPFWQKKFPRSADDIEVTVLEP